MTCVAVCKYLSHFYYFYDSFCVYLCVHVVLRCSLSFKLAILFFLVCEYSSALFKAHNLRTVHAYLYAFVRCNFSKQVNSPLPCTLVAMLCGLW